MTSVRNYFNSMIDIIVLGDIDDDFNIVELFEETL